MEARASPLAALGGAAAVALGALGVWLTLDGAGAAAVAISVLLVALAVLVLKPVPALSVLILTRFSFEMFWEQRVLGFSVLDFLGAGVPVAVLIAIFLGRPRLQHIPLARLLLGWAMVVVISAAIGAFAVGKPLLVVENTLRLTCGIPIFLLTVLVVRDFEAVWKLSRLWVIGALPVLGVFYVYGDRAAMEYHGVLRQKALYHDVVTPATVSEPPHTRHLPRRLSPWPRHALEVPVAVTESGTIRVRRFHRQYETCDALAAPRYRVPSPPPCGPQARRRMIHPPSATGWR
jgi:hypothetical protein